MKKNRKVFHFPVFFYIYFTLGLIIYIGLLIFCIYVLCNLCKTQEDRNIMIGVIVGFSIFLVWFFVVCGKLIFQWVVVDENKITARNIFGKIREVTWAEVNEVREVYIMKTPINLPKYVGYIVMFIDTEGVATKKKMSYNSKKHCIRIVAKRKDLECLLQFKPDLKIVKYHDQIG